MSRFRSLSEKLRRYPLLPAFLLSLLVHFLILGSLMGMMPTWSMPEPEIKSIDAKLVSSSPKLVEEPLAKPKKTEDKPPQPKKPLPEKPAPDPIPVPEEIQSEDDPLEEEEEGEDAQLLEGEEDGIPWPDIPPRFEDAREMLESDKVERWFVTRYLPDGRGFPSKGEIAYRVYRGEQFLEIGKARFSWALWQDTYRFSTKMQTSGLIALLRDVEVETESLGIISDKFYPLRYQVRRDGRVAETNFFDWSAHTVSLEAGGKNTALPLRYESQDLLSLQGQLPFWAGQEILKAEEADTETGKEEKTAEEAGEAGWQTWAKTVWIATGKRYEATRIVAVGEEPLKLGDNRFTTRHFRVSGRTETDFWLAKELYWLPVKIRHRDRRGDVYEERMERYEFQAVPEERREEPESGEEEQP